MFDTRDVQTGPNLRRASPPSGGSTRAFVHRATTAMPRRGRCDGVAGGPSRLLSRAVPGSVSGEMATSAAPESTPQRLAAIRDQLKLLADYL
jgi:hypothetical protein